MNNPIGRVVIAAIPGLVATVIAVVIVWQLTDHQHTDEKSLSAKLNALDGRLSALEQRAHPSTSKRFTSVDALALEARIAKCHGERDMRACLEQEKLEYEREGL